MKKVIQVEKISGICRFCGAENIGVEFDEWVKDTFTDFDKLRIGNIVCDACLFFFNEKSDELAKIMCKDKPQRMRNYSHFIVAGNWIPLSKGNKDKMKDLLFGSPFPELAAIADSGQKHIVFRAERNRPGSKCGWVQFEEQSLFFIPEEFKLHLDNIERLYAGFSKDEICGGKYQSWRIMQFGVDRWIEVEKEIKIIRGSLIFHLALFLAQREEQDAAGRNETAGKNDTCGDMEGSAVVVQEQVQNDDMGPVRKQHPKRGVHEQPGEISQLDLFQA